MGKKTNCQKEVWFDARGIKKEEGIILPAVYNTAIDTILVNPEQIKTLQMPKRMKVAVFTEDTNKIDNLDKVNIVVSESKDYLQDLNGNGYATALYATIKDRESLERLQDLPYNINFLIVKLVDETNIPLELLIAKLQQTDIQLFKVVSSSQEASIAFGVMEIGSDGVLLSTNGPNEIYELNEMMNELKKGKIPIVEAEVVQIKHIEMGERACVDTTSLINETEGMLIGSTSTGGILVCSEVHPLPYMNTRPFRVNAGAVHSYIWGDNDMVEYLTDLKVGSKVLCVDVKGTTRVVNVGRVKTEVRPLLLIEARVNKQVINVVVQDDWHVRIFGADGKIRNVTTLKPGEKILAHICEPGRHVGIKVVETILEK